MFITIFRTRKCKSMTDPKPTTIIGEGPESESELEDIEVHTEQSI